MFIKDWQMNENWVLPIKDRQPKRKLFQIINFRKVFLLEKLANPTGFAILSIFFILFAMGMAEQGIVFGVLILLPFIAIPFVYSVVTFPKVGIYIYLTLSYFIFLFLRAGVKFPLGTLMDGILLLLLVNLLIVQKKEHNWKIFKGPISKWVIVWIIFNLLEVGNPAAESRLAWVYTVRSVAIVQITYFIFLLNIKTRDFIKSIFKLWLFLALIGALYGLKQEYMGFFPFENEYLHSDPNIEQLLFIGGTWRKFSIFNDPVIFAYTMVVTSCLCIGLMTGPLSKKNKWILGILVFFYNWSMLYSGTRGAFVLLPAAMVMFAILKFNKYILFTAIALGLAFFVIINVPTSNYTLYRFQTAFKPDNDLSYLVRKHNQKRIQPYILSHPMGGGLGSTGEWGQRFAPNSYLAHFPPDSGYVRVAVECGWGGLLIFCTLMFTILKTGIQNYYAIKDPQLKSFCLAMLLIVCAFNVGNFPQEALVQFPSNIFFYLVAAIIVITRRMDEQQNAKLNATN